MDKFIIESSRDLSGKIYVNEYEGFIGGREQTFFCCTGI